MKGSLLIAILLAVLYCDVICDYANENIKTDVKSNGELSETKSIEADENVNQDEIDLIQKLSQGLNNIKNTINDKINDVNLTSNLWEIVEQSDNNIFRSENDDKVYIIKRNLLEEDDSKKDSIYEIKRRIVNYISRPTNDNEGSYDGTNHLSATMSSTENHFYCSIGSEKERHIILHGTKAWNFPWQDVNLTLSYPTEKTEEYFEAEEDLHYIITGFSVILSIDGSTTKGYITKGGILHDHITITFINTGISSLEYKFWLYGMPKDNTTDISTPKSMYYFCN